MKTVIFQDFKEGRHLGCNVAQFLAKQEKAQELVDDSEDSKATASDY